METKTFDIGLTVQNVVISPDVRYIAYCSGRTRANVFDTQTQTVIYRVEQKFRISALAFSPDNTHFAVGSTNSDVTIHSLNELKMINNYSHNNAVESVHFSPCGKFVISGGEDGMTIVWPLDDSAVFTIGQHGQWVYESIFVDDNKIAVLHDLKFEIWNLATNKIESHFNFIIDEDDYTKLTSHFEYNSTTRMIAFRFGSNLKIYDIDKMEQIYIIENKENIDQFEFSKDGSMLVCSSGQSINVWDMETFELIEHNCLPIEDEKENIHVGFCNDDMSIFVKSSSDTFVRFYNSPKFEVIMAARFGFLMVMHKRDKNAVQRFAKNPLFDFNLVRLIFKYAD